MLQSLTQHFCNLNGKPEDSANQAGDQKLEVQGNTDTKQQFQLTFFFLN